MLLADAASEDALESSTSPMSFDRWSMFASWPLPDCAPPWLLSLLPTEPLLLSPPVPLLPAASGAGVPYNAENNTTATKLHITHDANAHFHHPRRDLAPYDRPDRASAPSMPRDSLFAAEPPLSPSLRLRLPPPSEAPESESECTIRESSTLMSEAPEAGTRAAIGAEQRPRRGGAVAAKESAHPQQRSQLRPLSPRFRTL